MSDVFRKLAVIGAGNMGSGIAQKMATEGFEVVLVDLDDEKVGRGLDIMRGILDQGVERRLFKPEQVAAILDRVRGTSNWNELADVDLVVEAVFEDMDVKRQVFAKLDEVCKSDAVLGTNTSSLSVTELAEVTAHPERVIGLHYFFHPAKNRLVEVIPGKRTDPGLLANAWSLQEQLGKTPIASADAPGFVVNRYFVPWLNEAVRLLEEGVADIATIEASCKKAFGIGMGPFELMNVTGVPIALHAATTLGDTLGPFYAPTARLAEQVASGDPWPLDGTPNESAFDKVEERMLAVVFYIASALVDDGVGTAEDTDIGARVGLRWPRGPFEKINRFGVERARDLVAELGQRWSLDVPETLAAQAGRGAPFTFRLVKRTDRDGIATLTFNRPDAMNALNEAMVAQFHAAFKEAVADPDVRGIVIAGAGKAFVAGADIRFFVRNIDSGDLDRIVEFTEAGHALLDDIDRCSKPVVARMHGLALGGGLELAQACDWIVASDKAMLAFPETGIGIYPGLGGTQRPSRRIGTGLTKWLVYTGQMLGAKEAAAIGLIDAAVPVDRLDEAVAETLARGARDATDVAAAPDSHRALADVFDRHDVDALRRGDVETNGDARVQKAVAKVGQKAPLALRLAEKLIGEGARGSIAEGCKLELAHLREIFLTKDAYEGLSSLGRRRPEFKGE
ncbi:MAG: 3-hydroxyacyl-CoA dehydrogenase/enoyl-CoA hydratase family protein [Planctomycetota bacterium]|nr:3-hydroxyacyl-CoA dehydrogenase/enoyl-CoA hydratase family protein [Planctomycetota bacterium]